MPIQLPGYRKEGDAWDKIAKAVGIVQGIASTAKTGQDFLKSIDEQKKLSQQIEKEAKEQERLTSPKSFSAIELGKVLGRYKLPYDPDTLSVKLAKESGLERELEEKIKVGAQKELLEAGGNVSYDPITGRYTMIPKPLDKTAEEKAARERSLEVAYNSPTSFESEDARRRAKSVGIPFNEHESLGQMIRSKKWDHVLELERKNLGISKGASKTPIPQDPSSYIPGYRSIPGIKVTPKDVDEVKKGLLSVETAKGHLRTLKELVSKHGVEVLPGPIKDQMSQEATSLLIQSAQGKGFGVLSDQEWTILKSMNPDPTKLDVQSIGRGVIGIFSPGASNKERFLKAYENMERILDRGVKTQLKVRGFEPDTRKAPSKTGSVPKIQGITPPKGKTKAPLTPEEAQAELKRRGLL